MTKPLKKRKEMIAGKEAELVPTEKKPTTTAQQELFAYMLKTNIVDEFSAVAVDAFDEQLTDTFTASMRFSKATDLLLKAQDLFGLVANDLNSGERCIKSEAAAINFAAEVLIVARVLKIPKRDLGQTTPDPVSMRQRQTGNGIVTYESVLADLADEARAELIPDKLMDRTIAHPVNTANTLMAATRSVHRLVLKSIGPKASTDEAFVDACAAALIALTLVWDLRLFWVLGGIAGWKERIREIRANRTHEARAAKKAFLDTEQPTLSQAEEKIIAALDATAALDSQGQAQPAVDADDVCGNLAPGTGGKP
jgi:hypothetical protein